MPKILYISSADPTVGPGVIAMDHYKSLRQAGFEIDFLTLYKSTAHPEIRFIYDKKAPKSHNLKYKWFRKLFKFDKSTRHFFFFLKDTDPPVPTKCILKKIDDDYDMIIIFFWQELLSYKSVLEIFRHCRKTPKVVFISADYSPMTGGCHFLGDCSNYKTGCGNCPMIYSRNPHDFTAKNVIYRQKVVEEIRPYVRINSYMSEFFKDSPIMKAGARLETGGMIIDHELFRPLDMQECRKKLQIEEGSFVILFGCQDLNDPRKGIQYLIDALNELYSSLSDDERKDILLVSIGKDSEQLDQNLKFKRKHLGYVDFNSLPEIFSMANVFLSPSVNDAGPSMVNQSIACGTPVVAFEMGTAIDVIKNGENGYRVPLKDTAAFSNAIHTIYRMNPDRYAAMRAGCREISDRLQSYSSFVDFIKRIYDEKT